MKDAQSSEQSSAKERDLVMPVSLPIGPHTMLIGFGIMESMGQKLAIGNNFSIPLGTESEQEPDRIFNGLASGGQVTMPLEKAFCVAYFGVLTDKFGVQ